MPPPCCVMDNCLCQENNLICRESPGLFKTQNDPQSFFHHLHRAGPAAACVRTSQLRSDVAPWWFTSVEFKPIAARYVSRRESSGSSGWVTHSAGGDLRLGCLQRFGAFSQHRLFKAHWVKRGQHDGTASISRTQAADFSVVNKRLIEKVAAALSVYLHVQHGSSAGSHSSFPPNLTRKLRTVTLIE